MGSSRRELSGGQRVAHSAEGCLSLVATPFQLVGAGGLASGQPGEESPILPLPNTQPGQWSVDPTWELILKCRRQKGNPSPILAVFYRKTLGSFNLEMQK